MKKLPVAQLSIGCLLTDSINFCSQPDDAIFCSTPESVGPHGCCGNAFDSVGMIRKHMDGFFHCQIMHMDLCVSCTRYQNPVPGMRKELYGQTKTKTK